MVASSAETPETSDRRTAIGIDVGGTKIAAGVVSAQGEIIEEIPPTATPAEQNRILESLSAIIAELRDRHPDVSCVGVGAAGLIEWPDGFVRMAPNTGFDQMPLRRQLEEATGLPTTVDNDANVAAWAEARLGTSAPYMIFVTVGTGIGGGIVLDGRLYRGRNGIGAEIGHVVVDPHGGVVCGCGNVGCLEAVAAGPALGRYGRQTAAADPGGHIAQLAGGADSVTGEHVYQAALAGDEAALKVYAHVGEWLGIGLASLVTVLDLELIVVGGGVAAAGEILFAPVRESLARFVVAADHRTLPEIVAAKMGDDSGWIGAGLLAVDALDHTSGIAAPRLEVAATA